MKNTLMRAVFTVSMLVACPIGAADAPTVSPALVVKNIDTSSVDTTSAGWGICSVVSSVLSTPGSLHSKNPKITSALLLAVVAIIAYRIGAAEADEVKTKEGDLI